MEFKGTQGEWDIIEHSWSDTSIIKKDGGVIASLSIYDDSTEENQEELELNMLANAKLMAAAPYLLVACREALRMYDDINPVGGWQGVRDELDYAINKALK